MSSKLYYPFDPEVLEKLRAYEHHFASRRQDGISRQRGGRIANVWYEYGSDQSGNGWGWLRNIWRVIRPVATSGLKAIGKQALATTADYLGDIAQGANLKEAAQARAAEAGRNMVNQLQSRVDRMQSGGSIGVKRPSDLSVFDLQSPQTKVSRLMSEFGPAANKREGSSFSAYSIDAPPVEGGTRDLRLTRQVVKNKFGSVRNKVKRAKKSGSVQRVKKSGSVQKRKSDRIAGKKKV